MGRLFSSLYTKLLTVLLLPLGLLFGHAYRQSEHVSEHRVPNPQVVLRHSGPEGAPITLKQIQDGDRVVVTLADADLDRFREFDLTWTLYRNREGYSSDAVDREQGKGLVTYTFSADALAQATSGSSYVLDFKARKRVPRLVVLKRDEVVAFQTFRLPLNLGGSGHAVPTFSAAGAPAPTGGSSAPAPSAPDPSATGTTAPAATAAPAAGITDALGN